jgi:single-strand DNA-binding protein
MEGLMLKGHVVGNLGGNPELKYSADGRPVLRMNVASNYRTRTPEGEWQDRTEWVRVTVFGQRAEALAQHLQKGMRVYADGRLEAHPWTDRAGDVRAGLELIAGEVEFASQRQADSSEEARASVTDERPRRPPDDGDALDDIPF